MAHPDDPEDPPPRRRRRPPGRRPPARRAEPDPIEDEAYDEGHVDEYVDESGGDAEEPVLADYDEPPRPRRRRRPPSGRARPRRTRRAALPEDGYHDDRYADDEYVDYGYADEYVDDEYVDDEYVDDEYVDEYDDEYVDEYVDDEYVDGEVVEDAAPPRRRRVSSTARRRRRPGGPRRAGPPVDEEPPPRRARKARPNRRRRPPAEPPVADEVLEAEARPRRRRRRAAAPPRPARRDRMEDALPPPDPYAEEPYAEAPYDEPELEDDPYAVEEAINGVDLRPRRRRSAPPAPARRSGGLAGLLNLPLTPGTGLIGAALLAWSIFLVLKCTGPADETTPPAVLSGDEEQEADQGSGGMLGKLPAPDGAPTPPDDDGDGYGYGDDADPSGDTEGAVEDTDGEPVADTEGDDAAPSGGDAAGRPAPSPSTWNNPNYAAKYSVPDEVTYTVRFGGSMKNIANLYKLFHYEIEELNPGIGLEKELAPQSKVVVWKKKDGVSSESIRNPGDGALEGAMPMMDGPGRILKMTPWKSWATMETVVTLDHALERWAQLFPQAQPILVGNMSAREGGRLKPHSSHQSGRDVDLSYPQIWDKKEELNWRKMDKKNLDAAMCWELLKVLAETGGVEVILIDTKIQKLLYDHAVANGTVPKKDLGRWLEYPRGPGQAGRALVQHHRGHDDHLHVRFHCPPSHKRCQSRGR